jgi:hypothetical protein
MEAGLAATIAQSKRRSFRPLRAVFRAVKESGARQRGLLVPMSACAVHGRTSRHAHGVLQV